MTASRCRKAGLVADRALFWFLVLASTSIASGAEVDFATKCRGTGVIACWDFEDQTKLFYSWSQPSPCDSIAAIQPWYGFGRERTPPGNAEAVVQNGACVYPVIDLTMAHSGSGSIKFTIPTNSSADSSGFFSEPYLRNPDGSFPYIGPGSPLGSVLYFQFYQRFDSNFLGTTFQCLGGGCGGWKQMIWFGDPPNGASSSGLEATMNNGWQRGVPQMYGQQGTDDYGIQDVRGCYYNFNGMNTYPEPPCVRYKANQWMEFTGRLEIRGASNAPASRVQLWVDGQLVVDYGAAKFDWGPGISHDGQGFGQFLMSPYSTNKDPSQAHPTAYTWYDDLIVSTQPIPMRNGSQDTVPPAAPTGLRVR